MNKEDEFRRKFGIGGNGPQQEPGQPDGPGTTVIDRPPEKAPVVPDLNSKDEEKTEHPKMYNVFMLNDDYTPAMFVAEVIEKVFKLPHDEAWRRMHHAHKNGRVQCGMFTKDLAETKIEQVAEAIKEYGDFPLQADLEEAPNT
jgi:ATP-dependent Clp protease adaptor protein ClpS